MSGNIGDDVSSAHGDLRVEPVVGTWVCYAGRRNRPMHAGSHIEVRPGAVLVSPFQAVGRPRQGPPGGRGFERGTLRRRDITTRRVSYG